ncbi:MAG TPA: hypothetical protein P5564_03630, partial [Paludibacteraceae bacterium]|nr:hypothetical protein [Paludibacteraceae bacterium]
MAEIEAQMFSIVQKFNRRTELQFTTAPAITQNRCCVLPFCFIHLFVSHLGLFFVVRWLGGSFAKLGLQVGLCGFANVPPIALAYSSFLSP